MRKETARARTFRVIMMGALALAAASVTACHESATTVMPQQTPAVARATATAFPSSCTKTWLPPSGSSTGYWWNATSWSPTGVPGASDTVCVPQSTTYSPQLLLLTPGTYSIAALYVGDGSNTGSHSLSIFAMVSGTLFSTGSVTIASGAGLALFSDSLPNFDLGKVTNDGQFTTTSIPCTRAICVPIVASSFTNNGLTQLGVSTTLSLYGNAPTFENNGTVGTSNGAKSSIVFAPIPGHTGQFLQKGGWIQGSSDLSISRAPVAGDPTHNDLFVFSGGTIKERFDQAGTPVLRLKQTNMLLTGPALTGTIRSEATSTIEPVTITGPIGAGVRLILAGVNARYFFARQQPIASTNEGRLELTGLTSTYTFPGLVNLGTISVEGPSTFDTDNVTNLGTITLGRDLWISRLNSVLTNQGTIADTSAFAQLVMKSYTTFVAKRGSQMVGDLTLDHATLQGEGSVGRVDSQSGTIDPGGPIGTLTAASLSLTGASGVLIDVAGEVPGTFDKIVVNGPVTYGGKLIINNIAPFPAGECGQVIPIISDNSTATRGNFGQVFGLSPLAVGHQWRLYNPTGVLSLVGFNPIMNLWTPRSSVAVTEGGASDAFKVCLGARAPTADVVLTTTDPLGDAIATPSTVTFRVADWMLPRIVTMSAVNDAVVEPTEINNLTLTTSSSDVSYNNVITPTIPAKITDNDGNADLKIENLETKPSYGVGKAFDITPRVTNIGPTIITGGTYTFAAPSGVQITNVTGTGCTWTTTTVTCPVTTLAVGATQLFTIFMNATTVGSWATTGTLTSQQPDPVLTNNTVNFTIVIN